jgi:hypothetical protein
MKKLLLGILLLVCSHSAFAADTRYFSRLIHESDAPLVVEVESGVYMRINTFTQSGGIGGAQVGSVAVYQGDEGISRAATILLANSAPTGGSNDGVIVAGPKTVYIAPAPSATLFISYLLGRNY